jgi:hypothetical protein
MKTHADFPAWCLVAECSLFCRNAPPKRLERASPALPLETPKLPHMATSAPD